jgi:PAS domain S-box-containing protein
MSPIKVKPELSEIDGYKEFFEHSTVPLIRTDLKTGAFLMANRAASQLFGQDSVEELISQSKITDYYPLEERKKLLREIRKRGSIEEYELCLKVGNRFVWVSCYLHINGSCVEGCLIEITKQVERRDVCLGNLKEVGKKLDKRIAALNT